MIGRQGLEQEIRRPEDGGEQVVEVVRHPARESPHRLHFLGLKELQLQPLHGRHVFDHGQNPRDATLDIVQRRGKHVHRHRRTVSLAANQLDAREELTLQHATPSLTALLFLLLRNDGHWPADHLLRRPTEQTLGCRVPRLDNPLGIEGENGQRGGLYDGLEVVAGLA